MDPWKKLLGNLISVPPPNILSLEKSRFPHSFLCWYPKELALQLCSLRADVALSGVFDSTSETTGSWLEGNHQLCRNRGITAYIVCSQRRHATQSQFGAGVVGENSGVELWKPLQSLTVTILLCSVANSYCTYMIIHLGTNILMN